MAQESKKTKPKKVKPRGRTKVYKKPGPKGPSKLTEAVLSKLDYAFGIGCSDREACLYADIAPPTLYRWYKEHPELKERFDLFKEQPILRARETVNIAIKVDPDLAMKYLERRKKDEFSLRSELTGKDGKDLPTPILGGKSLDEVSADNSTS